MTADHQIAALFVATGGCYFGLPGIDPWDKARDARLYAGPWPVVAHPPCERWGRYWSGGPSAGGAAIPGGMVRGGMIHGEVQSDECRRWPPNNRHAEKTGAGT